jgi:cell division protein FtsQ
MRRSRHPTLRGSIRQNTVRVRERDSLWSSLLFRLSALASSLLIILGLFIWLWHIGWPQRTAARLADASIHLTQKAQFAVKDIHVEGRKETSKEAILAALGASEGSPILRFDPAAAQVRIAKLPWIASATVERRLPDTVVVHLTERVPMARWQHDNHTVVIDTMGVPLAEAKLEQFAQLPLVVGADAPAQTQTLLTNLKNYPAVQKVTTAAVRVSERRWDLHLEPNIIARLPEKDVDDALSRLSQLITDRKILERNLAAIDLRLPDRITFEPATTAKSRAGDAKL